MDKCNYWPDLERENPFKARNANQGPWLIHLANLCVMYECCGTLVKECVCVCLEERDCGCVVRTPPLSHQPPLLSFQWIIQMGHELSNDKKMHWVQKGRIAVQMNEEGYAP